MAGAFDWSQTVFARLQDACRKCVISRRFPVLIPAYRIDQQHGLGNELDGPTGLILNRDTGWT